MKKLVLISSLIFGAAYFISSSPKATFGQSGEPSQKTEPPRVVRFFKPKQTKVKRKVNKRKNNYPYFVPNRNKKLSYPYLDSRGKSIKKKAKRRGKIDLSKVPRVVSVTK